MSHRPGVDDDDDKAAIGVDTLDVPESLKLKITLTKYVEMSLYVGFPEKRCRNPKGAFFLGSQHPRIFQHTLDELNEPSQSKHNLIYQDFIF